MIHLIKIFLCILIVLPTKLIGQQLPQYTQWSIHQFAINPAHAGIKKCIDIHALYRNQWQGFDGAPKSGFVTASIPLYSKRKKFLSARHGMGIKFENDQIGQFGINRFNLAYAGHFNFTRDTRLSLGLYGGIVQYGFDPSGATTLTSDPSVNKEASFIAPDAHFGAWWNGENYYLGLIVNQLIPYRWDLGQNSQNRFHLKFNAGYRMSINDNLALQPSVMLRVPFAGPISADLNARFFVRNTFSIGAGYRNGDALLAFVGITLSEQFSIDYSYDITISPLKNHSNGTHEISLRFLTCKPISRGTSNCPLFN